MNAEILELVQKHNGTEEMDTQLQILGVRKIEDFLELETADLTGIGFTKVDANRLLKEVRKMTDENTEPSQKAEVAEVSEQSAEAVTVSEEIQAILSMPWDDDSLLDAIKQKNELTVGDQAYAAAIRADLASRAGLIEAPRKIMKGMLDFAEANCRPVNMKYFDIESITTRRNYAKLFASLKGGSGTAISKSQKKALLDKMKVHFWPAMLSAFLDVKRWRDMWVQNNNLSGMAYYGPQATLPPGVGKAPDLGILRNAADKLRVAMNKTLCGLNSMAADALFSDCVDVKEMLLDEELPALIGAVDHDQMMSRIGIIVDGNLARTEHNLVMFAVGMIKSKDVTDEKKGVEYFSWLYTVGEAIDWRLIGFESEELEALRDKVSDLNVILVEPRILPVGGEEPDLLEVTEEDGNSRPALTTSNKTLVGIPRLGD